MKTTRYPSGFLFLAALMLMGCPDRTPEPEPSIPFFGRDHGVVTRGTDVSGTEVAGEVTLSWQTLLAEDVRILANGEPIDLSDCTPTLDGACHEDGMVTHRPTEDTVYTLQAIRDAGDCTLDDSGQPVHRNQCAALETSVAVRAPARATLNGPSEPVLTGSDVSVDYTVENAETWNISRVRIENGERVLTPCVAESEADGDSRCILPDDAGVPDTAGTLTLVNVTAGVTLAVIADNGASDGLGRIRDGDLEVSVDVVGDPVLSVFEADPDTIRPFESVTLSWETENAIGVNVAVTPSDAVDATALEACSDVDAATGEGGCSLTVGLGDEEGRVVFTAVALGPTMAESAARTTTVDIDDDPEVVAFDADETHRRAGQDLTLSWTADRAVAVLLSVDPGSAVSATDLDGCTDVDDSGEGSCVVTITASTDPGVLVFSLQAEGISGILSDAATLNVSVGLAPDPTLVADPTQLPVDGGDVTLTWTAAGAETVGLYDITEDPAQLLRECTAEDDLCEPTGDSYVVEGVTENRTWRLVATNEFGEGIDTAGVAVAGQPQITAVAVDGTGALADPVVVETATAGLSWSTNAETVSTGLEHALAPDVGGDPCGSVADWQAVADFPGDANRDGTDPFDLEGIDADHCFRLTAYNVTNDTHRETFRVVRRPVVDGFAATPSNADREVDFTLAWEIRYAQSVEVTVSPDLGDPSIDLSSCNTVDDTGAGSCTLTVPDDAVRQTYEFSLVAHGPADSASEAATTPFVVSQRPFNVTIASDVDTLPKETVDDGATVTISWATSDNTDSVTLSAEPAVVDWPETITTTNDFAGTKDAEIFVTTTFTLTATNTFGDTVRSVTVHVDPRIDTLAAEDRYAQVVDLIGGGTHPLVTGEVEVSWTSSNATFSQLAHADPVTNCATVPMDDWTPVEVQSAPDDTNTWDLDAHRCFRMLVFNDYVPDDEQRPLDLVFFQLQNTPYVVDMDGPESGSVQNANPQPIDIDMWIDAATTLELRAQYLHEDGSPVIAATDFVCDETSLHDGELVGTPGEVDEVTCRHVPDAYSAGECLRLTSDCVPATTHTINYILTVDDGDGPSVTVHSVDYDAGVLATP